MLDLFNVFVSYLQDILTFFYNFTSNFGIANYGVSIILMTIVIKMLLYPLTVKQIKSMKAMQELQPKMKEMQTKYKDNPEKLQKEMTAMYKETGINPLAGCLPLIVQMPILIGIFYAIRDYTYLNPPPQFLWITDLASADTTYVLPVLSALTTYIQQKQTTTEVTQQTKMMLVFMPLLIGYISITFPAGLVLYWVMSNVVQIAQQWWMYRQQPVQEEAA